MKKNKKLLIGIGIVALLGIVSIGVYWNYQQVNEGNVVRIGAILPMTGSVGFEGERVLAAMKMALEEENSRGTNLCLKLIVEDGKWSAKDTITAFNRLISKNVDAIVVFGDTPCLVIDDVSKKNDTPVFCISGVASLIAGNPNYIQCLFPALKPVQRVAEYALKQDIKRVAVIHLNEPLCAQTVSGFCETYQAGGGTIPILEKFSWDEDDTKSIVSKALGTNPSAVFVFGYGPSYISVLNQIKTQGYKGWVLTDLNVVAVVDELLDKGDGIIYGDVDFGMESTNEQTHLFIQRLKQLYGADANAFAAFSYEAIRICSLVMKEADPNSGGIVERVRHIQGYKSIAGIVNYNENCQLDLPALVKKRLKDGTATILE